MTGAAGDVAPMLLDTHAWIWWLADDRTIPPALADRIEAAYAARRLWVSAISAWEVALLVQRGRVQLTLPTREWVARSESLEGLRVLPIDAALGVRSFELPDLHPDPADRMIVASAERLGAVLVTRDERLRAYVGIPTTWGAEVDRPA